MSEDDSRFIPPKDLVPPQTEVASIDNEVASTNIELASTNIEVASTVAANPLNPDYSADRALAIQIAGGKSGIIAAMDGVGSGGKDSARAAQFVLIQLMGLDKFEKTPTISQAIVELKNAIFKARNQIKSLQTETGNDELNTTVSAGIVCASPDGKNRFLVVAHVGDSRIYKYNPETGVLIQLTKDHSLVGALLAAGAITIQEAHQHPHRNKIYKSVGSLNAPKDIDILVIPLQAGDIYFAMSDGVPDNISPSGLPVAIKEEYQKCYDPSSKRSNLRMLAKALIQRAQNIMSTLSQHSKYDDACVAILKAPD